MAMLSALPCMDAFSTVTVTDSCSLQEPCMALIVTLRCIAGYSHVVGRSDGVQTCAALLAVTV